MEIWTTYDLVDFLMFSPRVYFRLIERYNQAVWPLQVVFVTGGLLVLALTRKRNRAVVLPALAVAWAFCAWQFLWARYAVINWPVSYAAAAFLLQAGLLIASIGRASAPAPSATRYYGGIGLMLFGLVAYPLLAPLAGRSLASAEAFGLMPDPTVATTLGALLVLSPKTPWLLLPVPLLWCAFSGLTLWALQDAGAWAPFATIIATLALLLAGNR
ncbi:Cytochrome c-type biogenesis protein DsbD, protein-disulfide reductase (plasmid) [Sinorhizobium sojae CCBAU 05684]|uniref:Cytochrome c-type biogenesis protein DsbD, protein-disulfide reductase n=1 Tax=Sinorhizobium sojae CCBAU 05684 TaxID=716928 RepID=A0A249PHN8_9HYPH|nr:DUF6064 family protein [Sinorhizobium sojae]ASY65450.1 Cytochrome c-type biogenesis protein DsbD, protein-disulfide reductase [Sinorhizobium sojae CCBAU 05684]